MSTSPEDGEEARQHRSPSNGIPEKIVREIGEKVPELMRLPERERARAIKEVASLTVSYSGPLPTPDILERYDAIVPGAADRIIRMAEQDLEHAIEMQRSAVVLEQSVQAREDQRLRHDQAYRMIGQLLGFLACLALVGASITFAWLGHPTHAALFGGGTVVAIASAFIYGKRHAAPLPEPGQPSKREPSKRRR